MFHNNQRTDFLSKVERINSELLTFTYGSLIVRLIKDYEKPEEINEQLEKMGYNIGIRLIDDFLAKSCISAPKTFKEAIEIIRGQAMPFYLNIKVDTITYGMKEYGSFTSWSRFVSKPYFSVLRSTSLDPIKCFFFSEWIF